MVHFGGKRNFHSIRILTVSVATAYTKDCYETDIYYVYEDRCFSIRMQGSGENCAGLDALGKFLWPDRLTTWEGWVESPKLAGMKFMALQ